ncbi:MAG: hypothetical protein ACI4MS_05680 [Candidatus Coproplasma sp.]
MKATKKIVGAACALVAAVALSAGSTFAWFTTSAEVTATGMHVQAVVPSSLMINPSHDAWNESNTTAGIALKSNPAWSSKGVNFETVSGANKLADAVTMELSTNKLVLSSYVGTDSGTGTATGDAISRGEITMASYSSSYVACFPITFYRQTSDTNEIDLYAHVNARHGETVPNTDKTLHFLHVGFLAESYATQDAETPTYTWASTFEEEDKTTAGCEFLTTSETPAPKYDTVKIGSLQYTKATKVLMVVYFEGNDKDCYNNNALSVHDIELSVIFNFSNETPSYT